ncbi:MAG: hypothetical protein ACJ8AJ_09015, partial [Gemmatimonadaceae bacterium]
IVEEARKNAEEPAPSRSRLIPRYVAAALVVAMCAWAWIAPPAWLVPRPIAAPSHEYRDASTRVALALHAQRIEAYRASHGHLPQSKREVGIAGDEITYARTDSLSFELSSNVDGQTVAYTSSQPRDRYLADAMTALRRSRR